MNRTRQRSAIVLLLSFVALVGSAAAKCLGPVDPAPLPPKGGPLNHLSVTIVVTILEVLEHLCI